MGYRQPGGESTVARPSKAEEAILLASDNAAVADYLVKRGEAETGRFWDSISEETEGALLERNDRLVNLRLAEYCLYPATANTLFHHDPTDWALRSLVLSNQKIAQGLILNSFPECLFGSAEALRVYLTSITPDDASVLFENPAIDDRFLEEVLRLGDYWQAMPERARLVVLSSLANNPKLQKPVTTADHADGWDWHMAGKPFHAAWRLVIALDVNADNARHLSHLYDRLAPYCLQKEGILDALPKWIPQNDAEREEEANDNERGNLSSYQSIRRAAAAMLLQGYDLKQEQLLEAEDNAIRCGAYIAGRFKPDEMKSAIERDGWLATASLMQNPNCWRTSEHREALSDGVSVAAKATFTNAPELAYWEHQRWENKIAKEHPEWFEFEEVDLEPEDKPLTESSTGDLVRQVVTSSAFKSIGGKVEGLAQSQRIHFWLLVVILAILIFRR
jgi:hypothetical protein